MRERFFRYEFSRADLWVRPSLLSVILPVLSVVIPLLVCSSPDSYSASEELAVLNGVVADSAGGELPGAKVRVVNLSTGVVLTAEAGKDGRFFFADLEPGDYAVEARAKCFETWRDPKLKLASGQQRTLKLRLKLCMGSHLLSTGQNFSTRTRRIAKNEREKQLIDRAEQLPCAHGLPAGEDITPSSMPTCANLIAKDYFFELVGKNKKGMLPEAGEGPVSAKAYYEAKVEYDPFEKQEVVKLLLEYDVYCGMLCGQNVVRTRWVFFNDDNSVAKVEDDRDCDCYMVS